MTINLSKLSFNEKLAASALLVSFLAMVVSLIAPERLANAEISGAEPIYISVLEMAHWIKDRENVQVIDLRDKNLFDEFHVPTSRNLSLTDLLDEALDKEVKTVLYAEKENHEIQAWFALTGVGHKEVHILRGGAYDWHQRILYPKLPMSAGADAEPLINEIKELSGFYGGRIEFVGSDSVLNYYSLDRASREIIAPGKKVKLVRMGC